MPGLLDAGLDQRAGKRCCRVGHEFGDSRWGALDAAQNGRAKRIVLGRGRCGGQRLPRLKREVAAKAVVLGGCGFGVNLLGEARQVVVKKRTAQGCLGGLGVNLFGESRQVVVDNGMLHGWLLFLKRLARAG